MNKGYNQKEGIDYNEIFAIVTRPKASGPWMRQQRLQEYIVIVACD